MKLSIVTTLYKSAAFIDAFYKRVIAAATIVDTDFEIIMVNDGSPDESLALAVALQEGDPRVVVVDLSRNFGHHRAMMTGLSFARGELVFLIDSDLDEDPELLAEFLKVLRHEDCDVVYGIQEYRRGNLSEVITGSLFYWLITRLGGISIPKNTMTVRLMTRRYVRNLLLHREREVVIAGLWVATGFKQIPYYTKKTSRRAASNYSTLRKLRLAIDYITSFSGNLLYFIFYVGIVLSSIAFLTMLYFVSSFLATGKALAGWTSIIASIWMFGGLTILLIGLIGIYIARIFNETKRRPYVVVRHVFRAARASETANQRTQSPKTPAAPLDR